MNEMFEQILRELHSLRNSIAPINITMDNLDFRMKKNKAEQDLKIAHLESRIEALSKRCDATE